MSASLPPHGAAAADPAPGWLRDAAGGVIGSLAVLAVVLTLGLLAFQPLGAAAADVGPAAGFVAATAGGIVFALLSRVTLPVAGPSSATALVLAGAVAQFARQLPPDTPAGLPTLLMLAGLVVVLSGVLQVLFALGGLASLMRQVPQPVLAGFMNGVAVLIIVGQVPLLLGLAAGQAFSWDTLDRVRPGAVALALFTAALIWLLAKRRPLWPGALVALVLGTLLHLLLGSAQHDVLGATMGSTRGTSAWPWTTLAPLFDGGAAALRANLFTVLSTAVVLALIGALESALNQLALDQQNDARHDPRRELLAIGLANVAVGALGGLPTVVLRARAMAISNAHGRTRVAALAGSAALGLLFVAGEPLLAMLPLPVLAGVMLTIAVALVDRWSGRLLAQWWRGSRRRELASGLVIMLAVCATTVGLGFAAGVGLGVALSLLQFVGRMQRSLIRHRGSAEGRPSRRVYPPAAEARLRALRPQIALLELEGALFFGSGDRLLNEGLAQGAGCRAMVLDLRRVGEIDETGSVVLLRLQRQLAVQGVPLWLSGVEPGSMPAHTLGTYAPSLPLCPDADRAVEAAELHLLGADAPDLLSEVPLARCGLLRGLADDELAWVAARLQRVQLAAGEPLFAEGDAADRLYVVTRGAISVVARQGRQRFLTISAGMMLGETAMLDGGGRSAGAVADSETELFALTQAALDAIEAERPALAARLYRNMAVHLSERLRSASAAWSASLR